MTPKLQQILLFVLLLALPFQLGKHFWPNFAFVAGQRVDYLSPTVYVSDVVIVSLFLVVITSKVKQAFSRKAMRGQTTEDRRQKTEIRQSVLSTIRRSFSVFCILLLYLSLGIFFSASPFSGWYSLIKLLEVAFVGWYIAQQGKQIIPVLFWAFSIDIILEGALGLLQFFHQGSIGGLWYFLGERTFSAATPGIANASIHGQLVLRPYATFPHPNVFAGFLVISLLFFLNYLFSKKTMEQWSNRTMGMVKNTISMFVLAFGFGVLLLTLSRVAIFIFLFLSVLFFVWKFPKLRFWILLGICVLGFVIFSFPLLSGRFLDLSGYVDSLSLRDILTQASWGMVVSHPLFGVGLGNFLPSLSHHMSSKLLFGFLQPVHNIFLLVLAETGIVGLAVFMWVFVVAFAESFKKLKVNSLYSFSFLSLFAICCIGMTDHYFLTLQQGQLLFALILGLSFSKLESSLLHK